MVSIKQKSIKQLNVEFEKTHRPVIVTKGKRIGVGKKEVRYLK